MKRLFTLMLMALLVFSTLSACGCNSDIEADLVFVNDSDAVIVTVALDFEGGNQGSQHANSSPLRRGESFGFEVEKYPVTVLAYGEAVQDIVPGALGSITIGEAPPDGERWYVTARDGEDGLMFTVTTEWPSRVSSPLGGRWSR